MSNKEGTLDDRYLEWLYRKIGAVSNRNPSRSFWLLAKQLYETPFFWFVPNDDNRAADGVDLRYEFLSGEEIDRETEMWLALNCSMLEMLIALARIASFESHGTALEWFWVFIRNLEIEHYTDELFEVSVSEEVTEALERINRRTYAKDGTGGLFPLRDAQTDQRKVELWYQMASYLLEGEYVNNGPARN